MLVSQSHLRGRGVRRRTRRLGLLAIVPLLLGAKGKDCCRSGRQTPDDDGRPQPGCRAPQQPSGTATIFSKPCFAGERRVVHSSVEPPAAWGGVVGSIAVGPGTRAYLCPPDAWCSVRDISDSSEVKDVVRVRVETAIWGVADLHTHPAIHYGFGADAAGNGGLFWGKPGMALASSSPSADLPACATDTHSGTLLDAVQHASRTKVLAGMHDDSEFQHLANGFPTFAGWPHVRSTVHQQMHVAWLHRAYQGGLRLMVAAAVDNQTLATVWHRTYGKSPPVVDPEFDFESAKRQLAFIKAFARANAHWMAVAYTPDEARQIVRGNRLAIVLGVEMDTLTESQILALQRDHGVRVVTPIHLANNDFGGTAVYDDLFNSNNHFLNGQFLQVTTDPLLTFQLNPTQKRLRYVSGDVFNGGDLLKFGALVEEEVQVAWPRCATGSCGHRNVLGLRSTNRIEELMRAGLLVDVAHMSDRAMTETIELAERHRYPVLNTHSGTRPDDRPSRDERAMRVSLVRRMARLGGVLGLPVGYTGSPVPIRDWFESYAAAMSWTDTRVALGTDFNGMARQMTAPEIPISYPFKVADGLDFRIGSPGTPTLAPLVTGAKTYDFGRDGLAHIGLLPEFLEAVRRYAPPFVLPLYRSAHDFIDMWQRAFDASAAI